VFTPYAYLLFKLVGNSLSLIRVHIAHIVNTRLSLHYVTMWLKWFPHVKKQKQPEGCFEVYIGIRVNTLTKFQLASVYPLVEPMAVLLLL